MRETNAPVEIAGSGSIGVLPSASSLPPAVPVTSLEVDDKNQLVLPSPILFKTGSDELLPESDAVLQKVADFLRVRTDVHVLRVEAHSDSMGAAQYNLVLTQKRAVAVGKWLVDHGGDCGRIETVGYGQTRPIASNLTEEGRRQNRRIVFTIDRVPQSHTIC